MSKSMSKSLVAFFSVGGSTAAVADKLAHAINADKVEIRPAVPYTDADIDWQNPKSRSSVEMKDHRSRPAISLDIKDISEYDIIFIGFPIWWYREPSVIDTFVETFDFSGKVIVPFATSGGSGLGDSYINIAQLAPKATVDRGQRFGASATDSELAQWAKKFLKD